MLCENELSSKTESHPAAYFFPEVFSNLLFFVNK